MKIITLEECLLLLDRTPYPPADWYPVHGRRPPKDGRPSAAADLWAAEETAKHLAAVDKIEATLRSWLARGDGIAVYRNENFGSVNLGHRKFNPWKQGEAESPVRLPDTQRAINWAYCLEACVPPTKETTSC